MAARQAEGQWLEGAEGLHGHPQGAPRAPVPEGRRRALRQALAGVAAEPPAPGRNRCADAISFVLFYHNGLQVARVRIDAHGGLAGEEHAAAPDADAAGDDHAGGGGRRAGGPEVRALAQGGAQDGPASHPRDAADEELRAGPRRRGRVGGVPQDTHAHALLLREPELFPGVLPGQRPGRGAGSQLGAPGRRPEGYRARRQGQAQLGHIVRERHEGDALRRHRRGQDDQG
mmetsp:Transcript_77291/g.218556  ORF Transcript_77291/g.218556 Transcript_77291/m.218556 type:complete len:230 (-) Transcript_77291:879-1568(-)